MAQRKYRIAQTVVFTDDDPDVCTCPRCRSHTGHFDPVTVGSFTYPRMVTFDGTDPDGGPSVRVISEMRHGVPQVVEVRVWSSPDGRAVHSSDFAALGNLKDVALNMLRNNAVPKGDELYAERGAADADWSQATRELDVARSKRRPPPASELREVAKAYRSALNGPGRAKPVEAVQLALGLSSYRTAARRIETAREQGYLPLTEKGKVNG